MESCLLPQYIDSFSDNTMHQDFSMQVYSSDSNDAVDNYITAYQVPLQPKDPSYPRPF